jgi:hypothetical protein
LTGIDEFGRHQTEVILPEDMAGESPQSHDDRHGIGRRANRIRIFWVADDADDTIFGQRAGRPRRRPSGTKLSAGDVMPDFNRVNQGDQHIDVEKKGHASSSRSALMISDVTITSALRIGRRGTPFRSAEAAGGRNECRANSDTTLPTV